MLQSLFPPVSESEFRELFPNGQEVTLNKGAFLFNEGDDPVYLHILLKGRLQVFKYDVNANEITLNFFEPVSLVAELAVLQGGPYPASARFLSSGSVLQVSSSEFCKVVKSSDKIHQVLLRSILYKLQTLNTTISRSLTMDATQRVAHFLEQTPDNCPLLKHHQIASMLSLRPETFSRVLKQLKQEHIIENDQGSLRVLNRKGLARYL